MPDPRPTAPLRPRPPVSAGPRRAPGILRRRATLVLVAAVLAFAVGAAVGARGDQGGKAVRAYARAWSAGDWATMYAQLDPGVRKRLPLLRFVAANRAALETATASAAGVHAGTPHRRGDRGWQLPVEIRTRSFGIVTGTVLIPVRDDGDAVRIAWRRRLVFPGLRDGERLTRTTTLPERGGLFARDGSSLASGPARASSVPDVAAQVVGGLGAAPPERIAELRALGIPDGANVGISGLERIFEARLAGVPGGRLRTGPRTIATGAGRPGARVRTTVDPVLERTAVAALTGRAGGVVVLNPSSGEVYAFAGIPFSILQPPGSTFKIITTAAALEAGAVSSKDRFPFQGKAVLSGVDLGNAGGEICGGSLAQAFAVSCNSVFAPLGVKVGARSLVAMAERFGFNGPPQFSGVAQSTLPAAAEIGDDLALGSTAIGQGRVQATTLQMAEVAATIAGGGRRQLLTLDLDVARSGRAGPRGERVLSARNARRLRTLMLGVVQYGTGTAAQIPGVPVAGKTGTAELRSRDPGDTEQHPEDTDAWFVGFAPARRGRHARVAVGVMLVGAGAGGDAAAPIARDLLAAALKRH